jgi:alkylation response protein AidB-like acyl-CoA dehydrogenase
VDLSTRSPVDTARAIAQDVLSPSAAWVDAAEQVPAEHLDLLAGAGLYGLSRDLPQSQLCQVVEELASGCLATAFVWLQHLGGLWAAQASDRPGIRERWVGPLARGERRGGVAQGALRPGTPAVRATRVDGGYVFDGEAPWVTGWGMIDTLYTAARDERDTVIWALLDAEVGAGLQIEALDLVAVRASRTVLVRFTGYRVPDDRVIRTLNYQNWRRRDPAGLRLNGSLALGVAARCLSLLGPGPLHERLDQCRAALDAGTPETLPEARAAAAALAARAAAALTAAHGAAAVLRGSHAERLTREALFLLVFGSRPSIKAALARQFAN